MLQTVLQNLARNQRPYYFLQDNKVIKGLNNQYWAVFKHRDADNLIRNIFNFFSLIESQPPYKIFRIDLNTAHLIEYTPKRNDNIPSITVFRTSRLEVIEQFLEWQSATPEASLHAGSFLEISIRRRRRFNLPDQFEHYQEFISAYLQRTQLYRRSTAFFESGVLKLYEEPLKDLVANDGEIRLLMDWQGFTNQRDVKQLEKLHDPEYRDQYIKQTLQQFVSGLGEHSFSGVEILAELVRLNILQIKLVKLEGRTGIYHKKTGILSDHLNNHLLHEGSNNFTRAGHTQNVESLILLYSNDETDKPEIENSIQQFDQEWNNAESTFDLTQEFLKQIHQERDRRIQATRPVINSATPDTLTAGETTSIKLKGRNLEQVDAIAIPDNELIQVSLEKVTKTQLQVQFDVSPDHPAQELDQLNLITSTQTYLTSLPSPLSIVQPLVVPEFPEIEGFKAAIEQILAGETGNPKDFLYWLAQQRPHLLKLKYSSILDELVEQETLFEHQKSGAQHCFRVMQNFGVAVCADAVGLGKSRLAAAVAKLYRQEYGQVKIAIIAASKLQTNWKREMEELGLRDYDYEFYNKNLMSRKGNNFLTDFNRYGGPDLVIIDEAHEGIRNYRNRIHKTCLEIKDRDREQGRQRHYLLLTATPWNNRREDIYNILSPFLTRPEGFNELKFPPEVANWFQNRDVGVENFTDDTSLFRRTYRELFLQRTRRMLKEATPDLNLYAERVAQWLPVEFEAGTEEALEQIFTQFEENLYIPFADPVRYLSKDVEKRSLLRNQRRMFLQRAESSMYALRQTIKNFSRRIEQVKYRLEQVNPDAEGLRQFLLIHYEFESEEEPEQPNLFNFNDWEAEEDEEEEEESEEKNNQKRQQLLTSIEQGIDALRDDPQRASKIYYLILDHCQTDLERLENIRQLLANEFVTDHKREEVTQQVKEIIRRGHKVLLISSFSDTVIDYYRYMAEDSAIAAQGIGMAIGSSQKLYYPNESDSPIKVSQNNVLKSGNQRTGIKRQQLFRLFAPAATCKTTEEYPREQEEINVLVGSETLSVGQNLQDADYLINIDLPWNPMVLEQRIGRIDRPKQHQAENIYIFYANSESQLLRQASRLNNLNKKLVGQLASEGSTVPTISDVDELEASIYGDTLFDDEILPGYINFIQSLVRARQMRQNNLQEQTIEKQETSRDVYTQNEILYIEELSKLVEQLGEDYQPLPITIGRNANLADTPNYPLALTLDYFGPNYEPIPEKQETIYWNELTGEQDGYGIAIATGFKTPEMGNVISAPQIISQAETLYEQLVSLKQSYMSELKQTSSLENAGATSQRINRIQKRIQKETLPSGFNKKQVGDTLNKLSQHKSMRQVQKLLKEYTDGSKSELNYSDFLEQLVNDVDQLNLLQMDGIKPTHVKVSLSAVLVRLEDNESRQNN